MEVHEVDVAAVTYTTDRRLTIKYKLLGRYDLTSSTFITGPEKKKVVVFFKF